MMQLVFIYTGGNLLDGKYVYKLRGGKKSNLAEENAATLRP